MAEFGIKQNEMDAVRLPKPVRAKNKQPSERQVNINKTKHNAHAKASNFLSLLSFNLYLSTI